MVDFSSGVAMVNIDGAKVKAFREEKGLTQLYLATSVEVTTDTISRWENKRYPKIKKENAIRLAEALEVSLEEIIDIEKEEEENNTAKASSDTPPTEAGNDRAVGLPKKNILNVLLLILAVGLFAFLGRWFYLPSKKIEMSAVRIVPAHIISGNTFPVVLKINAGEPGTTFIIKEIVPAKCSLVQNGASGFVFDKKAGEIKLLTKAKSSSLTVGYTLKAGVDLKDEDVVNFSGNITLRKGKGGGNPTGGKDKTVVSTYHWADTDRNNIIDDEEILAVYEDYNEIEGLKIDMDLIEEIWFGSGYNWDSQKGGFTINY